MKIRRTQNYYVDLYKESKNIFDHKKIYDGRLQFTGLELIEAIVSVGMPDVYLTKSEKRNRREEINFKIKLFETYVVSTGGPLFFDSMKKQYLDKTEIGAINYWIGMILTTVLGKKKYGYDFMVHLSMIEFFSSRMCIKKRSYFSSTGKIKFKAPDLLAISTTKKRYGVFESKGYSVYNKKAMEKGYQQAKSIKKINGKSPRNSLVVMTQTGDGEFQIIAKDPEGEGCEISIDWSFLHLYHYLPVVELIMELNPQKCGNYIYGTLIWEEEVYLISIFQTIYEKLSLIANKEEQLLFDNLDFINNLMPYDLDARVFYVK